MRRVAALALVAALTGCTFGGSGERTPTRASPSERWTRAISVRCAAKALRVEFDPHERLVVRSRGTTLATAGVTSHTLSDRCRRMADTCCDHEGPGVTVHERVRLRCVLARGAEISVWAIVDEAGRRIATTVVVAVRGEPMVSAQLEHPNAAPALGLWFAAPWCKRVS